VLERAFDSAALYAALDRRRGELGVTWREVLRQSGVAAVGTITYLSQGRSLSADTLLRLLVWLGDTDVAPYVLEIPMAGPDVTPPEVPAVFDVHLVALQEIDRIVGNELVLNEADTTVLRGLLFGALREVADRP
jgi:hypothetical protein